MPGGAIILSKYFPFFLYFSFSLSLSHSSPAVINGHQLILFGGEWNGSVCADVAVFDCATMTWRTVLTQVNHTCSNSLTQMLYSHTHTCTWARTCTRISTNSRKYTHTHTHTHWLSSISSYRNLAVMSQCLIPLPPSPPPSHQNAPSLSWHTSAVYGDHLYVMGGVTPSDLNREMFRLDWKTWKWTTVVTSGVSPGRWL